ncbi:flagellar hook-associated protein FlgL [Heyndrickxia oleronia]|uniref:Flagellar hook-associated protein FlgL n=1 Tax=Heyndrickxia oleronia TaxID=38875 RepID=A0A8E2LD02_9BACI|nr:flagellar hook-associated protein FlgL [Heyndrickxia oleronia]MEC1377392.1 flagellar hook-associated protein FlgL [Heyndrickxia oleronia]OOP67540.1 flagellar hook-associated protein FlgL [Heyndrickxia oleronia]QQZ06031.1 flagellar hook-associated protein FlgL [Heyndrickxia oleronia]
MRVTQSMLSNNFLKNISNSYEKMGKISEQMQTQKKITRPSDDPVVAMKGIAYRTSLTEVQQFKRNFSEAHNWLDNTDAALDQATKALQRIRELTVKAANGTLESDQREAVAKEIEQLRDQLKEIGNTQVGDKYLFNGTDTLNKPIGDIANNPSDVSNNSNSVKLELSKGVYIEVNSTDVFNKDLFEGLNKLVDDLKSGNDQVDLNDSIVDIDKSINHIINERATVGARSNRIDLMEDRIDQQEINATKMMSKNEDVDMEKVITDLITQEAVQRASLGMGARIIQPTLLDFLR